MLPLRHPAEAQHQIGELLALFTTPDSDSTSTPA